MQPTFFLMACVSMQVELSGGSQRHPDTQHYHTGISYIRATGTPVYNFQLVASADASSDQAAADASNDHASRILDDSYYSCEQQHACTVATTSANQSRGVVLRYIKHDNLVQTGGLHAKSERGRLLSLPQYLPVPWLV